MPKVKRNPQTPVVVRDANILGGRPVFRSTRVQAEILFENLAEGYSLDEILENFPTLDRDDCKEALRQACKTLMEDAPDVSGSEERADLHARVP